MFFFLQIYLYGGYFKEVSSDKEKGTVHADMWSLDPRTWEWNKVDTYIYIIILNVISVDFYLSMYLSPGISY
jgi:N-acetylneuraminic acid mutarotase